MLPRCLYEIKKKRLLVLFQSRATPFERNMHVGRNANGVLHAFSFFTDRKVLCLNILCPFIVETFLDGSVPS